MSFLVEFSCKLKRLMQVLLTKKMQEEVDEVSTDDDPNEQRHITIDFKNISSRYHDITLLGCGANALVFSALDQQCHRRIAVKKVIIFC